MPIDTVWKRAGAAVKQMQVQLYKRQRAGRPLKLPMLKKGMHLLLRASGFAPLKSRLDLETTMIPESALAKFRASLANSVKTWLVGHGASNQMKTQGFGDIKPVAPNTKPDGSDDPDVRQKNRRVEITLRKR